VAEAQSSDPLLWQARAAQARRIARMFLGRDAGAGLANAQECDEQGQALSAKSTSAPSRLAAPLSPRVVAPVSSRVSARRRAA
jgi:hypothetical protein